jgi:hypothetical protein
MKRTTRMLQALALVAASAALEAQALEVRPLLKAGYDAGGETLVSVTFTNGDRENIKANEGFYVGGGATILDTDRSMEYQLTLAYKFEMVNASNGDIEWTRIPLEALAFYRVQHARVGGGLAYHMNPRVEGSGVVGGLDVKFKNALGFIFQADWLITPKIALGARYTWLEYDAKSPASGSAKSNGVGLAFSIHF